MPLRRPCWQPFCSAHADLVQRIGEGRVRSGDHPRRRTNTITEPLVVEVETTLASDNGHADPAQVRPRLAEAAAASLDDISTALLDAALGAKREMWVTTACSGCGKKQRVEVKIPDVRSRVAAIELLLRRGLGQTSSSRGSGESAPASDGRSGGEAELG